MIALDILVFKLFRGFLEVLIFLFNKSRIKSLFADHVSKQKVISFLIYNPLVCLVIH
jgi:hypothetical protein